MPEEPQFERRPEGKQSRVRGRLAAYRARRAASEMRTRIPREAVPSFFTLMNLFSGFLSVIQTFEGRFDYACWLIVLAAFFDVLDGMMARITNTSSLFGIELDSLADVVSFGVAPSTLVYVFGLKGFGILGVVVSSLPVVCGAVRLARFNVNFDGIKRDYFIGLPTPGMAIILVAIILNFNAEWFSRYSPGSLSILIPIVILLSFLMVSNVNFDAIPKPTTSYIRAHPKKSLAYVVGLLIIIALQQTGLFIVLTVYFLFNIGRAVYRLFQAITAEEEEPTATDQSSSP